MINATFLPSKMGLYGRRSRWKLLLVLAICLLVFMAVVMSKNLVIMTRNLKSITVRRSDTIQPKNVKYTNNQEVNQAYVNAAFFLHVGCRFKQGTQSAIVDIVKAVRKLKYVSGIEFFFTQSDGELDSSSRFFLRHNKFQEVKPSVMFVQLAKEGLFVYEYPTLYNVWKYCKGHPERFVIYMHTLGSSKPWSLRRKYTRQVMQHQLLSTIHRNPHQDITTSCGRNAREKENWHCGPNVRYDDCWSHYNGNFWIASCSYVNTLKKPILHKKEFEAAMRGAKYGYGNSSRCIWEGGPTGRYWAEAWIIHGENKRTQDSSNPRKKLVEISDMGNASLVAKLVHKTFFSHNINLVNFLDLLARILGFNW